MPNKLLDYWCAEFLKAHGVKYPAKARDAALLKKILEECGDKPSLAWEIHEFHTRVWKTDWVQEAGYDTRMFVRMHLGLHLAYAKGREKELAVQKRRHEAELEQFGSSSKVIDLAAAIERRMGAR